MVDPHFPITKKEFPIDSLSNGCPIGKTLKKITDLLQIQIFGIPNGWTPRPCLFLLQSFAPVLNKARTTLSQHPEIVWLRIKSLKKNKVTDISNMQPNRMP
jgi:hypothetical protein